LVVGFVTVEEPSSLDELDVAAAGSETVAPPSFEPPPLESPPLESPPFEPVSDEPSSPPFDEDPDFALACRSFFAQPEPLKWIAGAEIAFRTGPLPHNGQLVGGSPWTPCMTSKRRPHAAQS
jgi:hypothetical protein